MMRGLYPSPASRWRSWRFTAQPPITRPAKNAGAGPWTVTTTVDFAELAGRFRLKSAQIAAANRFRSRLRGSSVPGHEIFAASMR